MKFGQKASGGTSFGQRLHRGASKLFQKYGDIISKAGNFGYATGSGLALLGQAELAAPIISLSALAQKGGSALAGIGSALEKSHNPHNKLA